MSFGARLGAAILGASLLIVLAGAAGAHEPGEPHKSWFESLQRPDNHLHPERNSDRKSLYCCGAADIVKTKFMVEPGSERYPDDVWYAWLNKAWTRNSAGEDPQGVRPRRAGPPVRAGRHDPVLRAAQGRPVAAITTPARSARRRPGSPRTLPPCYGLAVSVA